MAKPRAGDAKATDFITSHGQEATKQFLAYDAGGRMVSHYVALVDAANGDPCLLTQYTYIGASASVEKVKESLATWDSTWDL